jgi:thiopeptide-type bacteriocin biosynthesis protein
MELSEQIFRIDSETVLDLIDMLEPGDAGLDERWRLALHGAHRLMDDAGLDLVTRRDQTRRWCAQWLKPISSSADLRHQIAERYRKERSRLEPLLLDPHDPDGDLAPGIAIYQERSERLAPLIAELRRLRQTGELSVSLTGLVQSYVHMHLNRLLRSAANHHEVVIYDFLSRFYDARLARASATGPAG